MLDVLQCPKCKRSLSLAEGLWGPQTHCPTCGETVPTPAQNEIPSRRQAPPPEPAAMHTQDANIEVVPINLSLTDQLTQRVQQVPPPPPPLRLIPLAPRPDALDAEPRPPASVCPRCRVKVFLGAERCHACGMFMDGDGELGWDEREPFPPRRLDFEPDRGRLILALGILAVCLGGLGLPFGIAAWVMGRKDLAKIRQNAMDPSGYAHTKDGTTCGIIGTALSATWLVVLGWMMAQF